MTEAEIHVRQAALGDEPLLRAIRLEAMRDAPDADWRKWLSAGARVVRLDLMQTNARARRCSERRGFRESGQAARRENDDRVEIPMERPL